MGIPSVMEDKVLPDYLSRSTIPMGKPWPSCRPLLCGKADWWGAPASPFARVYVPVGTIAMLLVPSPNPGWCSIRRSIHVDPSPRSRRACT